MKKMLENENFVMFLKFSCVGIVNTVIDTAVFLLLCDVLKINEVVSNIAAYAVSALHSYFANSLFVYKDKKISFGKYIKFMSGNVSVLIISTISVMFFVKFVRVKTIAKVITLPITTIINFLFQRFVVFKDDSGAERGEE